MASTIIEDRISISNRERRDSKNKQGKYGVFFFLKIRQHDDRHH